jgi:sugar phosphate isomerase/epimerase
VEELCAFFTPLKEAAEKHGVSIEQMHAPFPVWVRRPDVSEHVLMAVEKSLYICEYVGCPALVVHPVSRTLKENEAPCNLAIYRHLMPTALKTGVRICLENMFRVFNGRVIEGSCSDVNEACWYIDTLNAEAGRDVFGFCLDVGHANLLGRDIKELIKKLGKRLTNLHIHDNDGREDLHGLPYAYTRKWGSQLICDWPSFVEGLKEIGYRGTLSFETFQVLCTSYPRPLWPDVLKLIAATGRYWADIIESEN